MAMLRALPAPASSRRLAPQKLAAVQIATDPPSSMVLQRGNAQVGAADPRFISQYQDWQGWARRYARQLSVVQFSVNLPASLASRCEFFIEERDDAGNWNRSEDVRLVNALDQYRNPRQEAEELIRMHFRHYDVAGECCQVMSDGSQMIDWWIFSVQALEWDKPVEGMVTVKLVPDGKEKDGTAFVVPREQVVRFWHPDDEWQALAVSPMTGIINDLQRYEAMASYAKATAESAAAMSGVLWTPAEAHEPRPDSDEDDAAPTTDAGTPTSVLEDAYYQLARRRLDPYNRDITAIVPPMVKWDDALKAPVFVKLVDALDPNGIAYRKEALEDIARGLPVPSSIVLAGGPGEANHWTEWLADRKFFDNACAPTLDQVTHRDLTATFLPPLLAFYSIQPGRHRIGYDPTPVIAPQDKGAQALAMYLAGLLSGDRALEANGYDAADRMTPAELTRVIEILSRKQQGITDTRTTTETQTPPAPPGGLLTTASSNGRTADMNVHTADTNGQAPKPTAARYNRLLARLARIRSNVGREMLAAAEQAFADALQRAGAKVLAKSKARASKALDQSVVAAVRDGLPLQPFFAAIGITEAEALRDAFATFETQATERLRRAQVQQRDVIERAGFDPAEIMPPTDSTSGAASYLAGALTALAYTRLMTGTGPQLVSGGRVVAGEVTGAVPARMVTQTLQIAEGAAVGTLGRTPGAAPVFQTVTDRRSIERALADRALTALREARAPNLERALAGPEPEPPPELTAEYVWRWAFYGDPVTPFEPHFDLGAVEFTTTDPTGDPALANDQPWPELDLYQPQDHDGCTCEWELVIGDSSEVQLSLGAPELIEV